MVGRIPVFIVAVLTFWLLQVPSARAQSCPINSTELGRSETKTKIRLTCRCVAGFWLRGGACLDIQLALGLSKGEFDLLVAGAQGVALHLRDALEKFALGKTWSPAALTAFLLSTSSAAQAKFGRARLYLSAKLDELDNDPTVQALARLLDAKQGELQTTAYINDLLDRQILSGSDEQWNEAARSEAWLGRYFADNGYPEEALRHFEFARSNTQDDLMYQIMNDAIRKTEQQIKELSARVPPSQREIIAKLARERATAHHAWYLGYALNEAGLHAKAAAFYQEAIVGFQLTRPAIVPTLVGQFEVVMRGESLRWNSPFDLLSAGAPPPSPFRDYYRNSAYTRADAILDAVEYGKGNWQRSKDFLEAAKQMDPDNEKFVYALREVERLSAQSSPQRQP